MPTCAVLPRMRAHSCSLVYFSDSGYPAIASSSFWRLLLDERRLHHDGSDGFAADLDVEGGAHRGQRGRQIGEPDGLLQHGAHGAAGHFAYAAAIVQRGVAVARDAFSGELEAGETPLQALALLGDQRFRSDESPWLVQLDDPAQACLERRVLLVHVVAVEAVGNFQSQR